MKKNREEKTYLAILLYSVNQEKLLRKTSKKKQEKEKKTFIDAWRRSDVSTCFYLAHARSTLVRVERASQLNWQRCMSPLSSANREKGLACVVSVACRLAKSREDRSTKTRKIYRDSFSRINLFSFVFFPLSVHSSLHRKLSVSFTKLFDEKFE